MSNLIVMNINDFDAKDPSPTFTFKIKLEGITEIAGYNYGIYEASSRSYSANIDIRDSSKWYTDINGNILFDIFIDFFKVRSIDNVSNDFYIILNYIDKATGNKVRIKAIPSKAFKKRLITFDRVINNKEFKKDEEYKIATQSKALLNDKEVYPTFGDEYVIYEEKSNTNNIPGSKWEVILRDTSIDTFSIVNYKK